MKRLLKIIAAVLIIFFNDAIAQPVAAPSCPTNSIFAHNGNIINNCSLPNGPANTLLSNLPAGAGGLAIGPSFSFPAPNPTWWTTAGGTYWYYNNSGTWSNTGHALTNAAAVNLGGGGTCLYNLVGASGQIYKYTGTGNDFLLTTLVPAFGGAGPYDVVCDLADNFYILRGSTPQGVFCYNPAGALTCSWSVSGMIQQTAGGGFAILCTTNPSIHCMYYNSNGTDYIGNMIPGNSNIVSTVQALPSGGDYACCALPIPTGTIIAPLGGTLTCNLLQISLVAQVWGNASLSWTGGYNTPTTSPVSPTCGSITWSGPGIVSGQGTPTINVNSPGVYSYTVINCNGCPNYSITASYTVVGQTGLLSPSITANPCYTGPSTMSVSPNASTNTVIWSGPSIVGPNNTFTISYSAPGVYTAVVSAGTCSGTATVYVSPAPIPTVSSNAPVCIGQTMSFTALGGNTYTWTGPNSFSTSIQNPQIPNAQLVNAGLYTLLVTNTAGCTGSTTIVANVNPLPTVTVNNPTACVGTNFNLTAGTGTAYAWTGPNAYNSALQNPPFANAQTTLSGNYTVVVTSAQGCTNSAVANVSVTPNPTSTPGSNSPVCAGGTLNLTSSAATSYTWSGPNAFASNAQNPSITNVTTAAAGNYTLKVTGAGGCTAQAVIPVVINPLPTITVNNPTVCNGVGATLTAGGASTYTWLPVNIVNASVSFTPAATTIYTVNATSAVGCTSSTTASITVNPIPTVLPGSNSPVCTGGTISFTVNPANTYTWTGPNAFFSNAQNPNIANASTVQAGNYTVTVASAQGCTAQAVTSVIVNPTPTITIGNTGPYCAGATIQLTVTASNTYTWNGPLAFASNAQNPTIANSATNMTGPYVVTVTAVGGCMSTGTTNVIVNPLPTPTATSNSPICQNQILNLFVNAASSYTWSGPNAYTSNAQNPAMASAQPTNSGNYTVAVSNASGCVNTSVVNVTINPLPAVVVNTPVACVGSAFNLTAAGGTAYAWTGPNAFNSTAQNPLFANAQTTLNGNYTVVVTSAQGCTSSAIAQVSVIGLPTVSVLGTNTLCSQNFNNSPASTTLTATGAGTYVWTLPGGFSGSPSLNSNPLVITPPVTTTSMVATMTVLGTAGNCTNQAVYNLTVLPNPTLATTSGSMCAGTNVMLTASNANTYTWSPSATLNSANGPSVIASPAVTTIYNIIGSANGCNSQTGNATANVVPNPTVSVNPNPAVICLNQSINLTAAGANNYTWSPNVALTTTLGPNTTANPTVTTVYQVVGEAATCTHVTTMTVQVLPLPTVNVVPSSPTLCMNNFNGSPNSVSLTASGAASYTWTNIVGLTTNTLNGQTIIGTSNGNPVATGSVIGANGTCTNVGTFTINAVPNPVIATTSGSMCAGTSVQLTAINAQTYTWSPSSTLNTANGPMVIASPTITTVYSVIGSSAGCQGQTQNATAIVVNNPTVSIAPLTPTICFGTSINLTAAGANNYTWSPNTAISTTVGNAVTVNPTVTTTYQIIGEASTCTHTAQRTVTVVPLPIIGINLSSPMMCMNNYNGSVNQITVTANGASSYNWIGFTGVTPNTTSGSPIVITAIPNTAVGTGTVVGSAQTCTSSATFTVMANPNPTIAVPSVSVCQFKSVDVVASGASTYTWSPANTLNSPTGATVTANPTLTTVYSVIGSSMNCHSPTQQTTVTVVANPQIAISPVNPTVCAGNAVGLTAFGANNYTWTPATNINTVNGSFVIVNPTITTIYQVLGEAATCTSTAVRQVSVIPLPDLSASVSPSVICAGDKAVINANGAMAYTWTPNVNLSSNTSNLVVANPTISMVYTLFGTNGICSASISVNVSVVPRPVLLLSTDNPKICQGASATIYASGAMAYSWTPPVNGNITNTTMATVTPSANTRYTVTGYNAGCPFTKEIEIEVVKTITATVSNSVSLCAGESVRLNAGGSNTYMWVPGAGLSNSQIAMPYADPKETTEYTVYVSDGGNCPAKATVLVKVNALPEVDAGNDVTFNADEPMYLNAHGTGTLTWTFGEGIYCHACPNSQIMTTKSGNYKIQAVNEFGCKATDDVNVEITNDYTIYIPNIFTPNYDGNNETFLVYGVGISNIGVTIFDRWGEQIYHDDNQSKGWDGTYKGELCKNDVYVYVVKYTSLDGKKHTKTGHVTLLK